MRAAGFGLLSGEDALAEYRFNTGAARHLFCRRCGIKSFYVPRSHPDGISVNARCLDDVDLRALTVAAFDDDNRQAAMVAISHPGDAHRGDADPDRY